MGPKNGPVASLTPVSPPGQTPAVSSSSTSSILAAALSLPYLGFKSHNIKPAKLTLTPHHLFYLLSRFEELGIQVGPMNVRLENIHSDASGSNYVSFLSSAERRKARGSDRDSMHSVSSVRSMMSGFSALWSNLGMSSSDSTSKAEKQKAAVKEDLKYLYSAFTKVPCLRLAPDHRAHLIAGFEEFPFDTAVPLFAFKNLSALEISDIDFRQFYGWDRMAEQLRSLTIKRGAIDDPTDLLVNIVLDDMDKRRRRSSKAAFSSAVPFPTPSPGPKRSDLARSNSTRGSEGSATRYGSSGSPQRGLMSPESPGVRNIRHRRHRSVSPARPSSSRQGSQGYSRSNTPKLRRESGSSSSSIRSSTPRGSSSNLLSLGIISSSKWRFLRHLSLADNSLTSLTASSLAPLANTLHSFDLSSNLFTEIPDSLATLTSLRALNLSNCMIEKLHSLARNPLPAITTLNLRGNRLSSLAGIERLLSLERLDVRENKLKDPMELARLTGIPNIHEVYVTRNPFVKSHSSYRVTIFNLFRSTPGYVEDIFIDSVGPGYSERKQLVDRVPEPANVPVIPPQQEEDEPFPEGGADPVGQLLQIQEADEKKADPMVSPRSKSEYGVSSRRRRKGPKRRIVDLSQNGHLMQSPPPEHVDLTPTRPDSAGFGQPSPGYFAPDGPSSPLGASDQVQSPASNFSGPPMLSPVKTDLESPSLQSSLEFTHVPNTGDIYKQKIEALRNDLGTDWLSALGEETWVDRQRGGDYPQQSADATRPALATTRSPSQGILSGGRTLG